jgi:GT2 family glycosyltransferase
MQPAQHDDVVAVVINYNTADLTVRCVQSLLDAGIRRILVLDNASGPGEYQRLRAGLPAADERVRVVRSEENLGFAQGSNHIIEEAVLEAGCRRVLLLNSDAIAESEGLAACLLAMHRQGHDLMGGRMLKPVAVGAASAIDSLGISLYKCLLASNRKSTADTYLGPTGGFAVLTRSFIDEVRQLHGHVFDPDYFCYAEDTDLCVRARLLGTSVGYADEVVAYHVGQGSHAQGRDEFILYHGIRNSIWMAAKSIPLWILVRQLPWFVFLHGGIVLRHTLQGRWKTLMRLYADAIRGMPQAIAKRRAVQASRRVSLAEFRLHMDRHFYEPGYLAGALRDLLRRRSPTER